MTKEQVKISKLNRKKAREYFGLSNNDGYDLHHIDQTWKENDIERYIQWNPEDLIVLTHGEHTKLHNEEREYKPHSKETKAKISESLKGQHYNCGENNPMYGKPSHRSKKVDVYYKGEFIKSFKSKKEASIAFSTCISVTGKEIISYRSKLQGYMFVYANN